MKHEQEKTGGLVHAQAGCDQCDWYDGWYLTAVKSSYAHTQETGHSTWLETGHSYARKAVNQSSPVDNSVNKYAETVENHVNKL